MRSGRRIRAVALHLIVAGSGRSTGEGAGSLEVTVHQRVRECLSRVQFDPDWSTRGLER